MVEKPSVSASQNFLQIENRLIIKKVMSINVCVCSFLIFDIFDIIALQPLGVFDLSSTPSTLLWSLVLIYLNTFNIKQYVLTHTF